MESQEPHVKPSGNRRFGVRRARMFGLVLSCMVAGVLAWNGFTATMTWTNTEHFCLSCHEMEAIPYAEYRDTIHDRNSAGVRATCSDCHVPHAPWPKFVRKVLAVNDVYHHLLGTVDTAEKFDARRLHMAQKVWNYMRSSDSRECRSCHAVDAMDLEAQSGRAARKHVALSTSGQTCIDCHKGIAHALPSGYEPES